MTAPATVAETMLWAMARELEGVDFAVQGIATPLVTLALSLAKRTVAPDLLLGYAIGNSMGFGAGVPSLIDPEATTLDPAVARFDFVEAAGELLPWKNPLEFFRPAQIDPSGATNNLVLGPYAAPKLRLPGSAGIPDVSPTSRTARVYIPRHHPRVFVAELDARSGAGYRPGIGGGPVRVFTNLCSLVLRDGRLGIEDLMPGVTPEEVQAQTGFPLAPGPAPGRLPIPPDDILHVIREELDPRRLRELDFLGTEARFRELYRIASEEEAARSR